MNFTALSAGRNCAALAESGINTFARCAGNFARGVARESRITNSREQLILISNGSYRIFGGCVRRVTTRRNEKSSGPLGTNLSSASMG
jgi:hypothetical protein